VVRMELKLAWIPHSMQNSSWWALDTYFSKLQVFRVEKSYLA
jgi:hypothetical protein